MLPAELVVLKEKLVLSVWRNMTYGNIWKDVEKFGSSKFIIKVKKDKIGNRNWKLFELLYQK